MKAGLDVAQMWLDGDEILVNTIDRDGNTLPISLENNHALTHDPLAVLVSIIMYASRHRSNFGVCTDIDEWINIR